jgi:hypothetical protein
MHVKYKQNNLHCMTWYTGKCGIITVGLLYMLTLWSNVCVMWALDPIVVPGGTALMGGHYKMNIICGVGHQRSDSIVPLMLCIVVCNG